MSHDQSDDVQEAWGTELDEQDAEDESDATDTQDTTDAENAQCAWDVESIRDAWNPNSVRLPDQLQRRFRATYSQIDSELTLDGIDRQFGKDRHYKPLVVALGLRALDEMDAQDAMDAVKDLERNGYLED